MSSSEQRPETLLLLTLPALQDAFCLSVSLTGVSSDLPELIFYNRPGLGQLCQHFMSMARTADFSTSGLSARMYSDSPVKELEGRGCYSAPLTKASVISCLSGIAFRV